MKKLLDWWRSPGDPVEAFIAPDAFAQAEAQEVMRLIDTQSGVVVAMSQEAAEMLGAFEEDALDEAGALDARFEPLGAEDDDNGY